MSAGIFSALVNLLYIAPTIYMLQVYDRVVPTQGKLTLGLLSLVLLLALATLALLDRVRTRLLARAGMRLDRELAPVLLRTSLGRPTPAARQALRELDGLRQVLTGAGILAVFDAPWMPVYIFVCLLVHPLIGGLAVVGAVLLPVIAWRNERATGPRLRRAGDAASQVYANQDDIMMAADVVRALGMQAAMIARHMRQRFTMMRLQNEAAFAAGGYLSASKFSRLMLQSLALGLGALLAIDNRISAGAIFASSFLIARALAPIEQLIGNWRGLVQAGASYRNLSALLAKMPVDMANTLLPAPKGALKVEQLTIFDKARDRPLLGSVAFSLAPGEVLAIVGPSGAGKSTLLRAIAGVLTPDGGIIRFDGAAQTDWDLERLGRHIGYLPQEPSLLAGTIKENICRFENELQDDPGMVDPAAISAAHRVGAHELILHLPSGYDYRLGLGGRGLSVGQAQRIALARAVYGDPALLILDEPNAHLDAEGDTQLLTALSALKQAGTTIIVVSHKLSILPVVDKLLVLRDGRVGMFGTRDEVLPRIAPQNLRPVTPQRQRHER